MKRSSRRGMTTLVETLVAISIGSMAFILASVVLARMMRGDTEAREHAGQTMVLTRLADQFRTDVHAGQEAKVTDDGAGLEVMLPESGAVSYRSEQGRILRTQTGPATRHETYRLRDLKKCEFAIDGNAPPLATLALESKTGEPKGSADKVRIAAAVGRDRRFLAESKVAKP